VNIYPITNLRTASVTQLVQAAQEGRREAFGELFERFERHIFSVALRRLRDHDEAQELCQDVFIQAMQKICQLREPECFVSWLRSIAHRMAINRILRRPPSAASTTEALDSACIEDETPLTVALAGERREQLRSGLAQLRDLDRRTLEAFYVQGQSLVEMSDHFDAPLGTIKRRLHVARKRLAKQMEGLVAV
jgi:RNA polymerase sigma-70 factor (ECF subfamily)